MRVAGGVVAAAVVIGLAPIAVLLTILALFALVFGPKDDACVWATVLVNIGAVAPLVGLALAAGFALGDVPPRQRARYLLLATLLGSAPWVGVLDDEWRWLVVTGAALMIGAGLVAIPVIVGLPSQAGPGRMKVLAGVLIALVVLIPLGVPGYCPRGI